MLKCCNASEDLGLLFCKGNKGWIHSLIPFQCINTRHLLSAEINLLYNQYNLCAFEILTEHLGPPSSFDLGWVKLKLYQKGPKAKWRREETHFGVMGSALREQCEMCRSTGREGLKQHPRKESYPLW